MKFNINDKVTVRGIEGEGVIVSATPAVNDKSKPTYGVRFVGETDKNDARGTVTHNHIDENGIASTKAPAPKPVDPPVTHKATK